MQGNAPLHLGRRAVLPRQCQVFVGIDTPGGKETRPVNPAKAKHQQLIEPRVRIHPGQLRMTIGHLGEVINRVLAIDLNDFSPRLEASRLGVNDVDLGDAIRSLGH